MPEQTPGLEFTAVVADASRGGHVVPVPPDVAAALGAKHLQRVKGDLAGVPFSSNLIKAAGAILLGVHKATLAAASKQTGDEVAVRIEADPDPR